MIMHQFLSFCTFDPCRVPLTSVFSGSSQKYDARIRNQFTRLVQPVHLQKLSRQIFSKLNNVVDLAFCSTPVFISLPSVKNITGSLSRNPTAAQEERWDNFIRKCLSKPGDELSECDTVLIPNTCCGVLQISLYRILFPSNEKCDVFIRCLK